jgi:hypothetical protein
MATNTRSMALVTTSRRLRRWAPKRAAGVARWVVALALAVVVAVAVAVVVAKLVHAKTTRAR